VELVADLDTSHQGGAIGFTGQEQAEVNGITFFIAETFADGKELWRTDGTSEGTFRLTDRMPGPGESIISQLTPLGNSLYVASNNNSNGPNLWRSDGTVAGTTQLGTAPDVRFRGITRVNDSLLLAGWDSAHGLELWLSNGTSEGPN